MIERRVVEVMCIIILAGRVPSAFGQFSPSREILCYDLGTLGGSSVAPIRINEAGQVAGNGNTGTYTPLTQTHAFFWTQAGGMVDLGTLGGQNSNARQLNEAGQVVGYSDTASGEDHAFLWSQAGGMLDLGTLGGADGWAIQINEAGQVVGDSITATGEQHSFLWTQTDGMVDLGTLGGTWSHLQWYEPNPPVGFLASEFKNINEAGQVVGHSETATGGWHAFLWTQSGGMLDLGTLGGATSYAIRINEAGQVIGQSDAATGEQHAFLWTQSGGMLDLGTLGGATSYAVDINEAGQVVGYSGTATGGWHAFLWSQASGMMDLGTLGANYSAAQRINGAGQVVGFSGTSTDVLTDERHAFLWSQSGGMVDLGTLGRIASDATDINDGGQVVGDLLVVDMIHHTDYHPFFWTQAGGMVDLGSFGETSSRALQINDSGQILAYSATRLGLISGHAIVCDVAPFLDKSTLYFNGTTDRVYVTAPQTVRVDVRGTTSGTWTVSADQPWLNVSPASDAGNGSFTVSVDPAGYPLTSWEGTITVSWSGTLTTRIVRVHGTVFEAGESRPPFGYFDTPIDGAVGITGAIPVTGWVLDDIEATLVQILRDPDLGSGEPNHWIYIGDAVFVEGSRPDVVAAHPGYPFNYRGSWGYMLLTNFLPHQGNGTYRLHALAYDKEGNSTLLGSRTFTAENASAMMPFGAIDTPVQGGTVSGTFRNWGWVLTPLPNTVPVDGSTISVWIDGVRVAASVSAGLARPDIQSLFPGYNNTDTAVHYYDLDTTAYENGVHTIMWLAEDDVGNADGIGSRHFVIENTGR